MEGQQRTLLGWSGVLIATILMVLASALILYPEITSENILTSLRFSSLTTAIPFLLIFVAQPLTAISDEIGQWLQTNRRYLWLILTISHLIHLYQIVLYYQLGESCSLIVWGITAPLWLIMVAFSAVELMKPQLFDSFYQGDGSRALRRLHRMGIWYVWLVFTVAFGLGAMAKHIPFYNVPALVLFLAGAIMYGIGWWRRVITA